MTNLLHAFGFPLLAVLILSHRPAEAALLLTLIVVADRAGRRKSG